MLISEKYLTSLVKPKMSDSEFKMFEKTLELFKGAIYDLELEEKIFYFKEGHKEGMQLMKEVFKESFIIVFSIFIISFLYDKRSAKKILIFNPKSLLKRI